MTHLTSPAAGTPSGAIRTIENIRTVEDARELWRSLDANITDENGQRRDDWVASIEEGGRLVEKFQSSALAENVYRTFERVVRDDDWPQTALASVISRICEHGDIALLVEIAERKDWCATPAITHPRLPKPHRTRLAEQRVNIAIALAGNPATTPSELASYVRRWGAKHADRILREAIRVTRSAAHIRAGLAAMVEAHTIEGARARTAEEAEADALMREAQWLGIQTVLGVGGQHYPADIHIAVEVRTTPDWVAAQRWNRDDLELARNLCDGGWEGRPEELASVIAHGRS